jgi:hypothetical protein
MKSKKLLFAMGAVVGAILVWLLPYSTHRINGLDSRHEVPDHNRLPEARPNEAAAFPSAGSPSLEESSDIRIVTGVAPASLLERVAALNRLNEELGALECRQLYEFLGQPFPDEHLNLMAGIQNELLHRLRRQAHLGEVWHQMLIALIQNDTLHPVTRDYALQHLFTWLEEKQSDTSFAQQRTEMLEVMWDSIRLSNGTIPGTALLGLYYAGKRDTSIDLNRLASAAILAVEKDLDPAVKSTALQVAGYLNAVQVLTPARWIAQSEPNLALRLSAIAAIGQLGERADLAFLTDLQQVISLPLLKAALTRASQQLEIRTRG